MPETLSPCRRAPVLVEHSSAEHRCGKRRLHYLPALDGLRGVAVAVVVATHLQPLPGLVAGQVAMDVFFGLSGFLITALLTSELAANGSVSLRRFYLRRARRLFPALWLFLGVWLGVVILFGSNAWMTSVPGSSQGAPQRLLPALEGVAGALTYLTNWAIAYHAFTGYVAIGHLWSLAVEEQFYLLWAPVALLLFRRRSAAVVAVIGGATASLAAAILLFHNGSGGSRIYFGTDTRAAALLLGALVALAWDAGLADRALSGFGGTILLALSAIALAWSAVGMKHPGPWTPWLGGWIAASIAAPAVVGGIVARPSGIVARLLSRPVLRYLGSRSYGIYLWHYLWATWLHSLEIFRFPLVVGASLICAEASWQLVEAPLRRSRSKADSKESLPNLPPGWAMRSRVKTDSHIGGLWNTAGAVKGTGRSVEPQER